MPDTIGLNAQLYASIFLEPILFDYSTFGFMEGALKGQQHLAQGNALGNGFPLDYALKGQKH